MSPIEKLKAEATELRKSEQNAGRELSHCEALEIVARRHGYRSWRACVARLTRGAPADPNPAAAPVAGTPSESDFRPSRLRDGAFAAARETAFTRWMEPGLLQAAADFSRNMGLLPIYAESARNRARYLFWRLPAGAQCEVRSGRSKATFLEFERRNRERGRRLLSLHVGVDGSHSAVWISADHYPAALQFLERYGIGPAESPDRI